MAIRKNQAEMAFRIFWDSAGFVEDGGEGQHIIKFAKEEASVRIQKQVEGVN